MAMPSDQAEQSDKMGFRSNGLDKARAVTEDPGCSGTSQKLEPLDIATDAEAGRPHRTKGRIALTITALGLACFLAALDMTIVTTALPTIAAHFDVSEGDYTWVGSCYMLAAAAVTPTWGKVSDIFGRKPIVLTANFIFFLGSLVSALSINIKMLLAGRVVQGIGGGGLLALVFICISDMFSERERAQYFSVISLVWALASALGPVVGGAFTEYVSWHWIFWINLPCDGLAFVILLLFLDIRTPSAPLLAGLRAVDWTGSITIVAGTAMFLIGLTYGGVTFPWDSSTVVCLIIFGLITFAIFIICEWKLAEMPIMPLRLFNNHSNVAALAVAFIHGFVFISDAYFLPLYCQLVLNASPVLSGVYVLPFVLSMGSISIGSGFFITKTGIYLPIIWVGMAILTLSHGLYIDLPTTASWPRIIIFQIISGIGIASLFLAPLIALQTHCEVRDMATITSTFHFMRQLASAVSVVIGGVIFQNRMAAHAPGLASVVSPELLGQLYGGRPASTVRMIDTLPMAQKTAVHHAYTESMSTVWIFYTAVAAVGLCVSFFIQKSTLRVAHEATKTGFEVEVEDRKEKLLQK